MTIFLLDPGHGIDTAGKRSPFVPPGVYEWEFNRDIARRICDEAPNRNIQVNNLVPELNSVTLEERVNRANSIYGDDPDVVFVSIHANAYGDGKAWSDSAHGATVFVYHSCSQKSLDLAEHLSSDVSHAGEFNDRGVKEANFYVLKKTIMPAVLVESGFMTSSSDATKLASEYWRQEIAMGYIKGFERFLG